MNAPEEFYDFCLYLHQDFLVYGPEPRDWIRGAMLHMNEDRRSVLKDYLEELLNGGYSDSDLQKVYLNTDAELRIWDDRGVRQFFELVMNTLNEEPPHD
ncbi:MAG TPA: hypothetical protein PL193_00930 [Xanthobacteraceae bacterium]|nr:hypothetical protein [Xanthobacteraceae bacterium]